MELFLNEVFSFPTIIFTVPLIVFMLFWLMAFAGLIDIEILDFDSDSDADATSGTWIESLGLDGVPLTVALTLVDIYAFAFTYLARKYLMPLLDGVLTATAVGFIVAIFAVVIAIPFAAICCKPLRKVFHTHEAVSKKDLHGAICTVTTQTVTESFGQATADDGMVYSIRANTPNDLCKGSRIVLLEFSEETDSYTVASEAEVMAMSSSSL
ncbi:OB-fold-containig protein [uncultured Paraglaciecola sp.]|uniref:OB-fold-containig protein n=1 Tax=uncultured Paraglaciecola sp. TaxID=1765024 RepID=UPI002591FED0|nr:OB-fold-containig protein [uncultured Paraglaciecola sp.]